MTFFEEDKCKDCTLQNKCEFQKEKPFGKGDKGVFLLSEWNSEKKEKNPMPVDKFIHWLNRDLSSVGIDLERDCWHMFAVSCFGSEKSEPTKKQIKDCRHHWMKYVQKLKPKKVFLIGVNAVYAWFSDRLQDIGDDMKKWDGYCIPDQDREVWTYPLWNPFTVETKKDKEKALPLFYYRSLEHAVEHDEEFPVENPMVRIIKDEGKAISYLEKLYKKGCDLLSFDYEATGIKPHRTEQELRTVAFSTADNVATAMPMFDDWRFVDLLRMILKNPNIKKTAHNMKFEHVWTKEKLGEDVQGWLIDTMLSSHILDNRTGTKGLKFQALKEFGVVGYDNKVEKHLKGTKEGEDEKSANRLNKIDECDLDTLLYYNGLDALYGRRIAKLHLRRINHSPELKRAYKLFHDGVLAFVDMEEKGWKIDTDHYEKSIKYLEKKKRFWDAKIKESESVNKYLESKEDLDEFNYRSTKQKREMFFDMLKCKSVKKTDTDQDSVDKEVLSKLAPKHDVAQFMLEYSKTKQLLDRCHSFQREVHDGLIHPSYNLHTVTSYRSSCWDPNQQNVNKRDKQAAKLLRSGIIPRKDRLILSKDFSGIEVATGCVYHKDPTMITYVSDESTDMHRDVAMELFFLNKEPPKFFKGGVGKILRYEAKNKFVFPQFYGDWYVTCSKNLWEAIEDLDIDGTFVREYLKEKGVKTFKQFENHVRGVENSFWKDRFKKYHKWKWDSWNEYLINGYVDFLTGFRATNMMNKKQVNNLPIQGTAFHILLWTLIEVQKVLKKENWSSFIIGQIHDDILFDAHPDEVQDLNKLVDKIGTQDIKKHWDWINIPLVIDAEVSEINGNWFIMEEL